MAMFVSRLPVGMPRSDLENIHGAKKAAVRSARAEKDRIMKKSLWTEYKY